jgi:hypothetical protein
VKPERAEFLDFLLGELPPERARVVAERIVADPAEAEERDRCMTTLAAIRAAAAVGWEAPPARPRLRLLRPALAAAAAILVVATGLWFVNREAFHPATVYEPDGAIGYLLAEEVDSAGAVRVPAKGDGFTLRAGAAEAGAIATDRTFPLKVGDAVARDTVFETPADSGARLDLPDGGILFLGNLSTVHIREHQSGDVALRLMGGAAATVVGTRPLHLAVDGTDLLLEQESGATFLRHQPGEAVCLRGKLFLRLAEGGRFPVPPAERLPAACAKEPATAVATIDDLDLDWYDALVYRRCERTEIKWERPGRPTPLRAGEDTRLYLHLAPKRSGKLTVKFGGEPRTFTLRSGVPFRLRLRLADLGPGPVLEVDPTGDIKEARLLDATPR